MIQKINQIDLKQNSKLQKIKQQKNQTFTSNPVKTQELMSKNTAQALKIQFTGETKDWKYYETHIKPLAVKNISMYHLINNQMVSLTPITKMENGKPTGYYENYTPIGEYDSSSKKYIGIKPEFQGKIFEYQKMEFQYDESNNAYRDEEKHDGYIYVAPDGSGIIFDKDLYKSKYDYYQDKEKDKIIDDEIFKDLTIDQAKQNIEYLTHCNGCDDDENLLIAKMIQALEAQLEKLEVKHIKTLMEQGTIQEAVKYIHNSENSGVLIKKTQDCCKDPENEGETNEELFKNLSINELKQSIDYLKSDLETLSEEYYALSAINKSPELNREFDESLVRALEINFIKACIKEGKILQAVEYIDNSKNKEFLTEKMRKYLGIDNIKPEYLKADYYPYSDKKNEFLNSTCRFSDVIEDIFKDLSIDEIKENISDLRRYDNDKNDKNSFCADVILALETNLVNRYMKQDQVFEEMYYVEHAKYKNFLFISSRIKREQFTEKIKQIIREIKDYEEYGSVCASKRAELENLYEELESVSANLSIDELKQKISDIENGGIDSRGEARAWALPLELNLMKAYIKQGDLSKAIEYINCKGDRSENRYLIIDRIQNFFKCNKSKKNPKEIDEDIFKDADINTSIGSVYYLRSYSNKNIITEAASKYSCTYNAEHVYLKELLTRYGNEINAIIAEVLPALEVNIAKKYIEQGAISTAKKYINNSENSEFLANRIRELFGLEKDFDFSSAHEAELENITIDSELNKKIEELQETLRKNIENSNEYANREIDDGIAGRAIRDVATLGIYELVRKDTKSSIEYSYLRGVRENSYRRQAALLYEQETNVLKIEKIIEFIQNFDSKIEETKSWLRKKYVDLVNRKDDYLKLPNCIMFTGENYALAQHLAKWCATSTSSDFKIVEYNLDNNKAQEDLYDALEASLENYENTGKRTIIYVESMERLLNPELNSDDNIADMKELMQCANEEYHATIMFNTNEPEKLNRESMSSNRVGLKVDNPITYDEANLRKYIKENNWEDFDYLLNK